MNNETNARPLPTTIPEYLEQLRAALAGADPAMIQDALYDAEEYLRSELAEQPGKSEADVIAGVAGSYGAPEEVAEIYRETEVTVNRRRPVAGRCHRRLPRSRRASPPRQPGPARPARSRPGRARRPRASSAWCWTRIPMARCSTCCCRWSPACSSSPGW